jgi:hypothetical protein
MTNSPGHSAYAGYRSPAETHGQEPPGSGKPTRATSRLSRFLWGIVGLSGLATFAVSFGSPTMLGFSVRLPVSAAIVATIGLLPRQAGRGWIVVALAVTGFSDALTSWIAAGRSGWALAVIVGLNALQSLAALSALLLDARPVSVDAAAPDTDHSAYADLVAAYQAYAARYQQASAQYGSDHGAPQSGQAGAQSREPFEMLQARYLEHGVGDPTLRPQRANEAPSGSVHDPGRPNVNRVMPQSQQYSGLGDAGGSGFRPTGH